VVVFGSGVAGMWLMQCASGFSVLLASLTVF
jgi:hypothetical protein